MRLRHSLQAGADRPEPAHVRAGRAHASHYLMLNSLLRNLLRANALRRLRCSAAAPVEIAVALFGGCLVTILLLAVLKMTGPNGSTAATGTPPPTRSGTTATPSATDALYIDLGQPVLRLPPPREMPPAPPEKTEYFPIQDLRPGMRGVTYTVLQGTTIVPVDTEVLGVIKNGLGPRLDLIIGKLVDPKTALTEAVHGMSGSPLYIDGKLVGALSRRIASFEKDGHCGFTPIADMLTVDEKLRNPPAPGKARDAATDDAPAPPPDPGRGGDPIEILARARQILGLPAVENPFLHTLTPPQQPQGAASPGAAAGPGAETPVSGAGAGFGPKFLTINGSRVAMEPLAVPLCISGAPHKVAQTMQQLMESAGLRLPEGFVATPGGSPSTSSQALGPESLTPGAPLSGFYMTGSITMNAVGTLTWRDGDRLLGFGHPMASFGHTAVPIGTAEIVTTIPSYERPFKMATPGRVVGTLTEDRFSAVGCIIGPTPAMGRYRIRRFHKGVERPALEGEFISHQVITPMLLGAAILAAATDTDDVARSLSVRINGEFRAEGLPPVTISNAFAGEETALTLGVLRSALPFMVLYNSRFGNIQAQSLDLTIETDEDPRVFVFESLTADTADAEPGDTIRVTTTFRERMGDKIERSFSVRLPPQLKSGPVTLRVGSGALFDELDWTRAASTARTLPEAVQALSARRLATRLVLQVVTSATPGEMVKAQELPALPSSVAEVMRSGNTNATRSILPDTVWQEQSIDMPGVLEGGKELQINIR